MVQYLQNNVIMKWTTRFIRFTGWIPLKYGSTTTPPIIAHCQKNSDVKPRISHCDSQNLQYKTHPEFWPSHRRIFKTSLYYKARLILETRRYLIWNNANLMDLIAATGLVILLKLDSNHQFFSPCDLEIWWMTPKNNPAPVLCYFKLFASFRSHWWIETGVTVRKRQIGVKLDNFF